MTLKDIAKQLTTAVQTMPNLVQILRDGLEQATAGSAVEVIQIVSSGTKIASVKVDGVGTDLYAPTSAHEYSTNEQIVGKWIDGSDVYEKTFTNVANGDQLLTGVSTVVDYRISAHGTSPNLSYHCIGDGFTIDSSKIFTLVDGTVTFASWTSTAGEIEKNADFIVIQYTKSST